MKICSQMQQCIIELKHNIETLRLLLGLSPNASKLLYSLLAWKERTIDDSTKARYVFYS